MGEMKEEEHARIILEEKNPMDNPMFARHEAYMTVLKKADRSKYNEIRLCESNAELEYLKERKIAVLSKKFKYNFMRKMYIGNKRLVAPIDQSFWTALKFIWQTEQINEQIKKCNRKHGLNIELVK